MLQTTFILVITLYLTKHILCFDPYKIVHENREVPPWTSYLYDQVHHTDWFVRQYVLQEASQRTYLMCPKGRRNVCTY